MCDPITKLVASVKGDLFPKGKCRKDGYPDVVLHYGQNLGTKVVSFKQGENGKSSKLGLPGPQRRKNRDISLSKFCTLRCITMRV